MYDYGCLSILKKVMHAVMVKSVMVLIWFTKIFFFFFFMITVDFDSISVISKIS